MMMSRCDTSRLSLHHTPCLPHVIHFSVFVLSGETGEEEEEDDEEEVNSIHHTQSVS